ncbi:MAG: glycosyltransferase family 2 protein, partial [Clostridia bacterium]|nr:glycosyltransferase family 2 protein [Clostridia bacterium]
MERTYTEGLVSVIMPIYNAEKYLADTLNSIFSQDYKDIEIVLVDDCSKDNSANIIMEYQKEHPQIVYYLQEKNMGAGAARNKALELAKGQYVAFLDSDDIWLPDKISRQIELMKKTDSPFSS